MDKENDVCAICMEKFDLPETPAESSGKKVLAEEADTIIKLECNSKHMFHTKCLKYWAEKKDQCPMCREPIVQNEKDSDKKTYEII